MVIKRKYDNLDVSYSSNSVDWILKLEEIMFVNIESQLITQKQQ